MCNSENITGAPPLLVVPAPGRDEVGVVELVVVSDPPRAEDAADEADEEDEEADPDQRPQHVEQAVSHQPELLENPEEADQADEPHEPHEAQHGDEAGGAAEADGHEDERVHDGDDHDAEVQGVPPPPDHLEEHQPVEVEPENELREEDAAEDDLPGERDR